MSLRIAGLALAVSALPIAACSGPLDLRRAAATSTHLIAHQLCSAAFVSGVDPERYYREAIAPDVAPVSALLRHHVDRQKREATASFAGMIKSRAVYRGETGCIVAQGPLPAAPVDPGPRAASLLPPLAGPSVVAPTDPTLTAALDHAFAETRKPPHRATKAVVVVRDGRVIAERYASGYGPQTPIHGWSMTKSVTNALLGVLVRQGRLDMDAPAPVVAWADTANPRRAITPDNLLRMTSGLEAGQTLSASWKSAFDPSAQMQFAEPDMARAVERSPVVAAPGAHFAYADANTQLLSRIIRDKVGGTGQSVLEFSRRELFDKLGMEHAVLEQDATGAPIGGSHMWATPRDWARLGLLYLNDGVVGSERILPQGWVDYSARLTPGSELYGYGAGFWTNRGGSPGATNRPHMPGDSFMARGNHGQYVIVIPSRRIVIVRMGDAYTRYGDIEAVDRLVGEVLAAVGG
jgi:hypothetical protein